MSTSFGSNPVFDPDMAAGINPLTAIWKMRLLFVATFVTVLVAVLVVLALTPSSYVAGGAIIIVEPERTTTAPSIIMTQNVGDPADVESQVYIAQSPRVLSGVLDNPTALAAVIDECRSTESRFSRPMDCGHFQQKDGAAIAYLDARYSVSGAGRSRVINISYRSPKAETAKIMANALIDSVIATHRGDLADSRAMALTSLGRQLDALNGEIRKENAAIQAFRTENGLVSGAHAAVSSEQLTSALDQLGQAEATRAKAAAVLDAIDHGNLEDAATLPSVLDSPVIADLKQQLTAANQDARSAMLALGPRHPTLKVLDGRVDALRASLRQEIAKFADNARQQVAAADGVVASLRARLNAAKSNVAAASEAESSIAETVRALAANQQRYQTLSMQKQGLETDKLGLLGRLRLVTYADVPQHRFFPRTVPFVGGGLALATVLAVLASLVGYHAMAWRIDDRPAPPGGNVDVAEGSSSQSEAALPLRVLARLPHIDLVGDSPIARTEKAFADPAMRAALRHLLAQLPERGLDDGPLTIAFLSALPREGRTMTALLLAREAAVTGRKVLFVEADLRSPDLQKVLALPSSRGLGDIFLGRASPSETVLAGEGGPDVILAGRYGDADPIDLLSDDGIQRLIAAAARYDLVVFDCPPLDSFMDGGLLARQTDAAIFCFGGIASDIGETATIAARIERLGVHVLGFVMTGLNAVDRPKTRGDRP